MIAIQDEFLFKHKTVSIFDLIPNQQFFSKMLILKTTFFFTVTFT